MSRKKILLVDDEKLVLKTLKRIIETAGFDVIAFNDTEECLEIVKDMSFDLAIVDQQMPKMNGDELIIELRKLISNVPCIMITGKATKDELLKIIKDQLVVRIVSKPCDTALLLATIRGIVNPETELDKRQRDILHGATKKAMEFRKMCEKQLQEVIDRYERTRKCELL